MFFKIIASLCLLQSLQTFAKGQIQVNSSISSSDYFIHFFLKFTTHEKVDRSVYVFCF